MPKDLNNDASTAHRTARETQVGFDERADLNQNGVLDVLDLAVVSRELPAGPLCR
jgi:hypothetical protein